MKLLLDIGNTRIKAVLSEPTVSENTAFERSQLTPVPFDLALFEQYPISQVSCSSVRLAERIEDIIQAAQNKGIKVVEATTAAQAFGVRCAYENCKTLGIDRWLAVLGAAREYPEQDVIVIDAGTAITVDFLTAELQHLGGWIVPGLELMTSSIATLADKVFDDANTQYAYGAGDTTPKALKYGCLAAQCGIVDQAVNYFDRPAKIIITGGTSELMLPYITKNSVVHDPMIVFKGLDRF